jgi:hypothetical protein
MIRQRTCVTAERLLVAACLLVGAGGCEDKPESKKTEKITPKKTTSNQAECQDRHAKCEVNGVEGRCMRGGRCAPLGPGCIHDIDCFDGNPCTETSCVEGECKAEPIKDKSCKLTEDKSGECRLGRCEKTFGQSCINDGDCKEPKNTCVKAVCSEKGECTLKNKEKGTECQTISDAPGTCKEGRCRMDRELAAKRRNIDCRTRRLLGRTYRRCDKSLEFLLETDQLEKARNDIRDRILEKMRYDMLVGLIELPDGGYNILTFNRRSMDKVRGLVDPSLVSFTMAGYTFGTGWRSRQLQIWTKPYDKGWQLPTSGARIAMSRGRDHSQLGYLGVVNVEAYREWLEKNFKKLPNLEAN